MSKFFLGIFFAAIILCSINIFPAETESFYSFGERIIYSPDASAFTVDESVLNKINRDPNLKFDYQKSDASQLARQIEEWIVNFLQKIFRNIDEETLSTVGKSLYYALIIVGVLIAIAIIVFFIIKIVSIVKAKDSSIKNVARFYKNDKSASVNYFELVEKSKNEKNYKEAIHYYYVLLLQKMNDCGIVKVTSSKTDKQYFSEIKDVAVKKDFAILVKFYKYAYFGNIFLTDFEEIEKAFTSLLNNLRKAGENAEQS